MEKFNYYYYFLIILILKKQNIFSQIVRAEKISPPLFLDKKFLGFQKDISNSSMTSMLSWEMWNNIILILWKVSKLRMALTNPTRLLCSNSCVCLASRTFVTSSSLLGRQNKLFQHPRVKFIKMDKEPHPFDDRFYISPKDVSRHKKHGSEWAETYVQEHSE